MLNIVLYQNISRIKSDRCISYGHTQLFIELQWGSSNVLRDFTLMTTIYSGWPDRLELEFCQWAEENKLDLY